MVKFGKIFQEKQVELFKGKYIDYKKLKTFVNKSVSNEDDINKILEEFMTNIDPETRKVFSSYIHQEKQLNISLAEILHNRESYETFSLDQLYHQYSLICKITADLNELVTYVYYNLIAMNRILKRIDKKFQVNFSQSYIEERLEEKGKGLVYVLKLRVVDEIVALIEDIMEELKERISSGKCLVSMKTVPIDESKTFDEGYYGDSLIVPQISSEANDKSKNSLAKEKINKIKKNLDNIDDLYIRIQSLFSNWRQVDIYLNKMQKGNGQTIMNIEKELNLDTMSLMSKANIINIWLILFSAFLKSFSYSIVIFSFEYDSRSFIGNIGLPFLGDMISLLIIHLLFKKNKFKLFLVIFMFLSLYGNTMSLFRKVFGEATNLAGRFLVGIGTNLFLQKKYLSMYCPKRKVDTFFFRLHLFFLIGFVVGSIASIKVPGIYDGEYYGEIFCTCISFVFLIIILSKFNEPEKGNFSIYKSPNQGISFLGKSIDIESSIGACFDTPNKLQENKDQKEEFTAFQDINLMKQCLDTLAWKEKRTGRYIYKMYLIFLIFHFFVYFIITLNLIVFLSNIYETKVWLKSIETSVPSLFCLLLDLGLDFLFCNEAKDRICFLVLFFVNFIINIIFFVCWYFFDQYKKLLLLSGTLLMFLVSYAMLKVLKKLSERIIPNDFIIIKLRKGYAFELFQDFGVCVSLIIFWKILSQKGNEIIIFMVNASIVILIFIIFIILYPLFKGKPISRLLSEKAKSKYSKGY